MPSMEKIFKLLVIFSYFQALHFPSLQEQLFCCIMDLDLVWLSTALVPTFLPAAFMKESTLTNTKATAEIVSTAEIFRCSAKR